MEIKKLKTEEFDKYTNYNMWICNLALSIEQDETLTFILDYIIYDLDGNEISTTTLLEQWSYDEKNKLIFNVIKNLD